MNFWIENCPSPPWNFSKNSSVLGFGSLTRPLFGFQKRMEDKEGAKWLIKYLLVSKCTSPSPSNKIWVFHFPVININMKLIRQMFNVDIDPGLIKLEIYWEGKITQEFTPQDVIISSHSFQILSNSANSASGLCNYVRALNILDKISMHVDNTTFGQKTRISPMVLCFVITNKVSMFWNKECVFLGM